MDKIIERRSSIICASHEAGEHITAVKRMNRWLKIKRTKHLRTYQLFIYGRLFRLVKLEGIGLIYIKGRMVRFCIWWG